MRLKEKALHEEERVLDNARLEEREKWQGIIREKEAALADKDAKIAELRALLSEK